MLGIVYRVPSCCCNMDALKRRSSSGPAYSTCTVYDRVSGVECLRLITAQPASSPFHKIKKLVLDLLEYICSDHIRPQTQENRLSRPLWHTLSLRSADQ